MSRARDARLVERVAIALWNVERREIARDDGGTMPSFSCYADGDREPMPFALQSAEFKTWWRARARPILRVIRGARLSGSGRAP